MAVGCAEVASFGQGSVLWPLNVFSAKDIAEEIRGCLTCETYLQYLRDLYLRDAFLSSEMHPERMKTIRKQARRPSIELRTTPFPLTSRLPALAREWLFGV